MGIMETSTRNKTKGLFWVLYVPPLHINLMDFAFEEDAVYQGLGLQ